MKVEFTYDITDLERMVLRHQEMYWPSPKGNEWVIRSSYGEVNLELKPFGKLELKGVEKEETDDRETSTIQE